MATKKKPIKIKAKNKGKFTAKAKKAGRTPLEEAQAVLDNPKSTALQRKRAQFVVNASKWQKG